MNNDDLMFEYLVQMGAMRPEEAEMKRQQSQVDALRSVALNNPPQGQMVGKHYVGPSWAQGLAQLGTAYLAGQRQKDVDAKGLDMNTRQADMLKELRKRRTGGLGINAQDSAPVVPDAAYQAAGY